MENTKSKTQYSNKHHLEMNSHGVERRKQQRRAQADRREIIRFGYDITTRRFGKDRRKNQDTWKGYETF
jgi:hypothetical protein